MHQSGTLDGVAVAGVAAAANWASHQSPQLAESHATGLRQLLGLGA